MAIADATGTSGFPNSLTTDGFTLSIDAKLELIQQTDQFGDSIIDGIYRGGNCFCDFESKTFVQGSVNPFWPYHRIGIMLSDTLPMGRQMSASASAFVITVVANTPAAPGANAGAGVSATYVNTASSPTASPMAIGTLTAPAAVLPPDANQKLLFTSRLRMVPCRLVFLPTIVAGPGTNPVGWFATS